MTDKRMQYPRDDWADRERTRNICANLLLVLGVFVLGAAIGAVWLWVRA